MTDKELLDYFHEKIGVQKHRKPSYIDLRNYIIAVLHYKFGYSEFKLADIFKIKRTSVNYGKTQPYYHIKNNDSVFLENAEELINLFPCELPDPESRKQTHRVSQRVVLNIDKKFYDKLKIKAELNNVYVKTLIKEMLYKIDKAW